MEKVILITGASSGMGEAAARLFANSGWKVVAGARSVDKIPNHENILKVKVDVTNSDSNKEFVNAAINQFGRIDVLINCAGYGEYGPTEEISLERAKYQFDVNYFSAVEITNLVLSTMRKQKSGRIINVSSIGGDTYMPLGAHYHGSKAALQQWSDVLDMEIRQFGLRSIIIQPGGTKTGWQAIAYGNTDENTSKQSPYTNLIEVVGSITQKANLSATADDLAQVFYKAATANNPKRRYYNSFGDRMFAFSGRVFSGLMGSAISSYLNSKLK